MIETEPPVLKAVFERLSDNSGGYYAGLPFLYDKTTKNYPLIVFLHGAGQFGDGGLQLPLILNDGIATLMQDKKFPSSFRVNGVNYSFVVLTPQFSRYPANDEVLAFLSFARKAYRIDTTRIYLAGLSMGGFVTSDFGAAYPTSVAAIVPISGALSSGDIETRGASIANNNLPVWVFHNLEDPGIHFEGPKLFVSVIERYRPLVMPKITLFPAFGHDAWSRALDPGFKEDGRNVYEWMLQYRR